MVFTEYTLIQYLMSNIGTTRKTIKGNIFLSSDKCYTFRYADCTDRWVTEDNGRDVVIVEFGVGFIVENTMGELPSSSNGNCHRQTIIIKQSS